MKILDGKKSYAAAIGVICVGVGQFLQNDATLLEMFVYVFNGLGIAGLKHAVSKSARGEE